VSEELQQTIVFEIQDEKDARRMCEILAMNGYSVKAKLDLYNSGSPYLIYVQAK